jgi:hypothetical protein
MRLRVVVAAISLPLAANATTQPTNKNEKTWPMPIPVDAKNA